MSNDQQLPETVQEWQAIATKLGERLGCTVCIELKAWWFDHIGRPGDRSEASFRVWVSRPNSDGVHYEGRNLKDIVAKVLCAELAPEVLASIVVRDEEPGAGERVDFPAAVDPVAAIEKAKTESPA